MRKIDKLLALLISSALILPAAGCGAGNISDAGGSLETPVSSVSGPAEDSGTEKAAVPTEDSTAWDEEVNPKCGDYEYVKNEDGNLTIVRYTGSDSEIRIPSELDGMKVTAIGSEAFAYCGSVRKLSLSEGIKEIADQAFLGCSFLESVELPGTLADLGANPFIRCFKISEFVFPSGSDYLEYDGNVLIAKKDRRLITYPGKASVSEYSVPEGTKIIGKGAFTDCTVLTEITLPEGLEKIEDNAFERCMGLIRIGLPSSLKSIGEYAFSYCNSLALAELPEGLESIGDHAFHNCPSLLVINIPATVSMIGDNPFTFWDDCKSKNISVSADNPYFEMSDGVLYGREDRRLIYCPPAKAIDGFAVKEGTEILGGYAFDQCSSLTSVSIPGSVRVIGKGAFCDCSSLEDIVLPETVTEIGDFAFVGCASIKEIKIPDGVTEIGDQTFAQCASLVSITVPDSVTLISTEAFLSCSSLTELTIPDSVISIGDRAFGFCESLRTVVIGPAVSKMGANPFACCRALNDIRISPSNGAYEIRDGALIDKAGQTFIFSAAAYDTAEYKIPDGVRMIGPYAFCESEKLKTVIIPSSVSRVGEAAFYLCTSLTELDIPGSVIRIDAGAFSECSALGKAVVPDSVAYIGEGAFAWCNDDLTLCVAPGSYAEGYCKDHQIKYEKIS